MDPDEIDSIFDGMDYIGKLVDLRNGLIVTSNQYSTIETDEEGYVTGMRKIPTVYEKGQPQAATQAGLTEPVNSPFAPGDDAPVETKAQAPQQRAQQAPQQAQRQNLTNGLVVFEVDHIIWASMMPSKSSIPASSLPRFVFTMSRGFTTSSVWCVIPKPCRKRALTSAALVAVGH